MLTIVAFAGPDLDPLRLRLLGLLHMHLEDAVLERVDDLVLRLPDVERRRPGLIRAAVALEEAVHETARLTLHAQKALMGLVIR
jgi:hypothetical protein